MLKRKNKKGFTLAELLIVVAIIAVLVAIAVPLFIGALDRAEKARDDANLRAVRGAAVVEILNTQKPAAGKTSPIYTTDGKYYAVIMVTANLDSNGNITGPMTYKGGTDATTLDSAAGEGVTKGQDRLVAANGGFTATVFITPTDLKAVPESGT